MIAVSSALGANARVACGASKEGGRSRRGGTRYLVVFDFERWLHDDEEVPYDPRYTGLPAALKDVYSPKEYAWLSDQEKYDLLERNTDPDPDEWGV